MKIKVSEATGPVLDWMVAQCKHRELRHKYGEPTFNAKTKRVYETEGLQRIGVNFSPSTDWSQGGPIKTRELIATSPRFLSATFERPSGQWVWQAHLLGPNNIDGNFEQEHESELVATMRCYVVSKLGEVVDVPDELFA